MAQQFDSMELGWAIGIELPIELPAVRDPAGSDLVAVDETFIARVRSLLHSKLDFPKQDRFGAHHLVGVLRLPPSPIHNSP